MKGASLLDVENTVSFLYFHSHCMLHVTVHNQSGRFFHVRKPRSNRRIPAAPAPEERGRMANAELAQEANISAATCHRRVQRLMTEGYVRDVRAQLEPAELGFGTLALVGVVLDRSTPDSFGLFEQAVHNIRTILDCYLVGRGFRLFSQNQGKGHGGFQPVSRQPPYRPAWRTPDTNILRHEGGRGWATSTALSGARRSGTAALYLCSVCSASVGMGRYGGRPASDW
jgi:hypothetical protein